MNDGTEGPNQADKTRENINPNSGDNSGEPAFVPPEQAATEDTKTEKSASSTVSGKGPKWDPVLFFKKLSKKQKILAIVVAVVLLAGAGGGVWALLKPEAAAPAAKVEEKEPEPPQPIYSPLTGVKVTKAQSELPVTGIMIENSPDSRPQAGLNQAGVVFEAIAEGGITRFLALFQENQADYVGPVRSVRPYYVDWLQGFDAAVAHVGGSGEALAKIKNEGVKDLDQFANSGAFRRVSNRYAPHNVYTSLAQLTDLQRKKGWNTSKFTGFPRKADAKSATPNARTIDINVSRALYNVHFDYDPAKNAYKRVLGGKPHTDERSGAQISPKVVVGMVIPYSIHGDGIHSVYRTVGSGKAYIFQDGVVAVGTWTKASPKAQIIFKDAAGKPLSLNAGQTWITATSVATNVTYKP